MAAQRTAALNAPAAEASSTRTAVAVLVTVIVRSSGTSHRLSVDHALEQRCQVEGELLEVCEEGRLAEVRPVGGRGHAGLELGEPGAHVRVQRWRLGGARRVIGQRREGREALPAERGADAGVTREACPCPDTTQQ